jgi:hypothetical protein
VVAILCTYLAMYVNRSPTIARSLGCHTVRASSASFFSLAADTCHCCNVQSLLALPPQIIPPRISQRAAFDHRTPCNRTQRVKYTVFQVRSVVPIPSRSQTEVERVIVSCGRRASSSGYQLNVYVPGWNMYAYVGLCLTKWSIRWSPTRQVVY